MQQNHIPDSYDIGQPGHLSHIDNNSLQGGMAPSQQSAHKIMVDFDDKKKDGIMVGFN